jgi:hypothetical protein
LRKDPNIKNNKRGGEEVKGSEKRNGKEREL